MICDTSYDMALLRIITIAPCPAPDSLPNFCNNRIMRKVQ